MVPGGINPLLLAGGVSVAQVFAAVTATAANLQAALDATGVTPGLLLAKNRDSVSNWVLRSAALGLSQRMATDIANGAAAFTSYGTTANFVGYAMRESADFYAERLVSHTNGAVTNVTLTGWSSIGMAVAKRTDSTGDWFARHRSLGAGVGLKINGADVASSTYDRVSWSSNVVTLAAALPTGTYLVTVFGHDTTASGLIQCGSYTGNGSGTGPVISLGWPPQFLLRKNIAAVTHWTIHDAARSPTDPRRRLLYLGDSAADTTDTNQSQVNFTSTGFEVLANSTETNGSGNTIAYVAIRAP